RRRCRRRCRAGNARRPGSAARRRPAGPGSRPGSYSRRCTYRPGVCSLGRRPVSPLGRWQRTFPRRPWEANLHLKGDAMNKWIGAVSGVALAAVALAVGTASAHAKPNTLTVVGKKGAGTVFITNAGQVSSTYPGALTTGDRIL